MNTFKQISVKLKTWKSSSKKIWSVKWRPYNVRAWYAWVLIIFYRFIHLSMPLYHISALSQKDKVYFGEECQDFLKTSLTHCSLVTPYGVSDWINHLCLYCFFSLFQRQAITWINGGLLSTEFIRTNVSKSTNRKHINLQTAFENLLYDMVVAILLVSATQCEI